MRRGEVEQMLGRQIREMRIQKGLSQRDLAKRTGIFSSYISRIENGHIVPAIDTLEKLAQALETPLYQFFHEGEAHAPSLKATRETIPKTEWGSSGKWARFLGRFQPLLARMDEDDRKFLLVIASWLGRRRKA
jgi:transcriptional regulator with XRE-family HTH domain